MGTTEGEENEPLVPILAVGGQQSVPLTASVELNGVPVTMEVDTGVTVSLMSEQKQRQLFPQVLLEKPTVRLTMYTMESIKVVGQMTVQVKCLSYVGRHTLYVVRGSIPTLLGREWLQHVRLYWKSLGVAYVHDQPVALTRILQQHTDVFRDELGLMDKLKAELVVKPGETTTVLPA